MIRRLLRILGRRTILTFGLVTFLVGALLATVNITSRYALKLYVDDQLRRIPWDLAVYQQGAVGNDRSLPIHIAHTTGVTRVESQRAVAGLESLGAQPKPKQRLGQTEVCIRRFGLKLHQLVVILERIRVKPQRH